MGKASKNGFNIPCYPQGGGFEKTNAAMMNNRTFLSFFYRLKELAVSTIEWINLPDTCDERFIEEVLFDKGMAVFFNEDNIDTYLCLMVMLNGEFNVYNIPKGRTAFAVNGFQRNLTEYDSVIIFNNYIRQPTFPYIYEYALRLYEVQRTIDVNIKTQKKPILIRSSNNQKLTAKNIQAQIDGNEPYIFLTDNYDTSNLIVDALNTNFVADKLQDIKMQIWREALSYLGIQSSGTEKRERVIKDEVKTNNEGTNFQRFTRISARQQACDMINRMYGLDISVQFRELEPDFLDPLEFSFEGDVVNG